MNWQRQLPESCRVEWKERFKYQQPFAINAKLTVWLKVLKSLEYCSTELAYHLKIGFIYMVLLRSEIPSGICAKLRTAAASNNRVHMPWSLYYCLFAPHICMVLFFTHNPFVVNHTINATPPERLQQKLCLKGCQIKSYVWSDVR